MRLTSQLYLSVSLLLGIALACTGLTLWSAQRSAHALQRVDDAHRVYESYLKLSNNSYRLFKKFSEALVTGENDTEIARADLIKQLRVDIASTRRYIAIEVEQYGEEEAEEFELLADIERTLERAIADYQGFLNQLNEASAGMTAERWIEISNAVGDTIDKDFRNLVITAIEGEIEEVEETKAESAELVQLHNTLAGVFAILSVFAAAFALFKLIRNINTPVERLVAGTSALERGELDHRVKVEGPVELSNLAQAFNHMAEEISSREERLTQANVNLEKTVAERTSELQRLLDTLEESENKRRQLLADVSHELRTPLTIIRGEAQIALRGDAKPLAVYQEALRRCKDSAVHTSRLVDDLLFVARNEAQQVRLEFSEFDLEALARKATSDSSSLTDFGGSTMTFFSDCADAVVRADEGRIRQVLIVLLENAVRYGGKSIEVRISCATNGFRVSVVDDGPGMSDSDIEQAFERFFRGSDAALRYEGGSGLGLPVAKAIVEAHGGQIMLKSGEKSGLEASFILPGQPQLRAVG